MLLKINSNLFIMLLFSICIMAPSALAAAAPTDEYIKPKKPGFFVRWYICCCVNTSKKVAPRPTRAPKATPKPEPRVYYDFDTNEWKYFDVSKNPQQISTLERPASRRNSAEETKLDT